MPTRSCVSPGVGRRLGKGEPYRCIQCTCTVCLVWATFESAQSVGGYPPVRCRIGAPHVHESTADAVQRCEMYVCIHTAAYAAAGGEMYFS